MVEQLELRRGGRDGVNAEVPFNDGSAVLESLSAAEVLFAVACSSGRFGKSGAAFRNGSGGGHCCGGGGGGGRGCDGREGLSCGSVGGGGGGFPAPARNKDDSGGGGGGLPAPARNWGDDDCCWSFNSSRRARTEGTAEESTPSNMSV